MKEFRKEWTWPAGLADSVYFKIRKWDNQYESGTIFKARATASARYGMELPDTEVLVRLHRLAFTFSELKWLEGILKTEDKTTSQSAIFTAALKMFVEQQESGRAPAGLQLPFDLALTKDEVQYIRMLLESIGIWRKPTPSEAKIQAEMNKKGVKEGNW